MGAVGIDDSISPKIIRTPGPEYPLRSIASPGRGRAQEVAALGSPITQLTAWRVVEGDPLARDDHLLQPLGVYAWRTHSWEPRTCLGGHGPRSAEPPRPGRAPGRPPWAARS